MTVLPQLDRVEIATGFFLTRRRVTPDVPIGDLPRITPRAALEEQMLPALQRGPCIVAFSGGRDSSSILAVATRLARREGLPDPVPATLRYPEHPRTFEDDWQEAVVQHLHLTEWLRIPVHDRCDIAGPAATALLRDHGLYWPANSTSMVPLAEHARGGSIITGNGGDEIMTPWPGRWLRRTLRGRERPTVWALSRLALGMLPHPARLELWRRRRPIQLEWLTAEGNDALADVVARRNAAPLRSWSDQLDYVVNSRIREVSGAALRAITDGADVMLAEPFFSAAFAAALAAHGPRDGFAGRSEALRFLFADLLPEATITRQSKATFTETFFGPEARAFAEGWDGTGVDERLVDAAALRAAWARRPHPDMRTFTLLQSAWLHAHGHRPASGTAPTVASIDATAS